MPTNSSKKTYVLLASFLLLLLFVILFEIPKRASDDSELVLFYPSFNFENVQTIDITSPAKNTDIFLFKEQNTWKVWNSQKSTSYPVDPTFISDLQDIFTNVQKAAVVSNNPSRFDIYEVEEKNSLNLIMKNSQGLFIVDLIIGKNGQIPGTEYIRLAQSDNVLLIKDQFRPLIEKDIEGFRDKRLFTFEKSEDLTRVYLENDNQVLDFEKKDGIWKMVGQEAEIDITVLQGVLDKIQILKVDRYVYESGLDSELGVEKPAYGKIVVKLQNGNKQEVWLGNTLPEVKDDRYALSKQNGYIGIVKGYSLSSIFKPVDEFIKKKVE